MGPLVTREHRDKVAGYLDAAREQGATVVTDGREDAAFGGDGFFLGVSLIDDVRPDMTCYTDEIFGPVLSVVRASSYDEALGMVNDNPYGNGVAIFTRDGGAARQFQFDVNVGMVGVNVPIPVPVSYYSFGGWKASLFGDQHMYGPDGINFYTRQKVVTSRWPDPGHEQRRPGIPEDPMMADAQDLLAREEQAWNRMWAAVERVPAGDRDEGRRRRRLVGPGHGLALRAMGGLLRRAPRDHARRRLVGPVRARVRRVLGSHEPGHRGCVEGDGVGRRHGRRDRRP